MACHRFLSESEEGEFIVETDLTYNKRAFLDLLLKRGIQDRRVLDAMEVVQGRLLSAWIFPNWPMMTPPCP
jgi:hypothetical protein